MWNSFDVSVNGGFVNDTQGGSATKKKEQVRRAQNIVPVFISYITECTDEEFTLQGMSVQMVDVLGVIRNFDVQSTKATCLIEDQTGSIQAILWLETDGNSVSSLPPVKENCYARVFGSVRTQDGAKMIMILKIVPVDDVNVITHHRLQIIHAKLTMQKAASGVEAPVREADHASTSMSYGDVKVNSGDNSNGLKPMQAKILSILEACTDYVGVSKDQVLSHFEAGQAREVINTINFLLDEGHAYTTCDNDHFKSTTGM